MPGAMRKRSEVAESRRGRQAGDSSPNDDRARMRTAPSSDALHPDTGRITHQEIARCARGVIRIAVGCCGRTGGRVKVVHVPCGSAANVRRPGSSLGPTAALTAVMGQIVVTSSDAKQQRPNDRDKGRSHRSRFLRIASPRGVGTTGCLAAAPRVGSDQGRWFAVCRTSITHRQPELLSIIIGVKTGRIEQIGRCRRDRSIGKMRREAKVRR